MTEQEKQAVLAEYAVGNRVAMGRYDGQDMVWRVLEARGRMRLPLSERVLARRH